MTLEDLLTQDTILPHDEPPHGVPTAYDWQARPVIQAGGEPAGCTRFNPWGQLYVPAGGCWGGGYDMRGARVEIRELRAYTLSRTTQTWTAAYGDTAPALTGTQWPENYQGTSIAAHIDTSRPGSILTYPDEGYLFHFYPSVARVAIDPVDVCGVAVTCRARMGIVNTALGMPRLILNVGADYWPTATSGSVRGVGQGRFKVLDQQWRVFGFTTAPHIPLSTEPQAELR
jgi:hypothetical protein